MRALFVHDHIFYRKDNEYYSSGGLPTFAWKRYLENVDYLYIVSRGREIDENESKFGLIKSSTSNVKFDLLFQVKGGFDYYKFKPDINNKLEEYIQKVDFVIIRVPSTIGYFAYKLCKKHSKPYVTEVVGCAWDSTWNYGSLLIKLQAPVRYFQMKKIVKSCMASTYVTQYFLQKRYPSQSRLTTYASNVQIPIVSASVKENHLQLINRKQEDNDKVFKIGIIGNLNTKYKGFDIAVKALKKLKENSPSLKFQFFLVGGGDQNYIKKLIKENQLEENCKVVGRLQVGEEIFGFLDSLDLYIHPSKQEGLPRVIIEAMSRACPVLASSVAGIPELINEEFLHKPGDVHKLYEDLKKVLSNSNLRMKMASDNFEKAKKYGAELLEKRRIDFFEKVVSKVNALSKESK